MHLDSYFDQVRKRWSRSDVQEIWRATQEQVAANNELLRQLSARAGLPSNSHAAGDGIVQRMQELLDGAGD